MNRNQSCCPINCHCLKEEMRLLWEQHVYWTRMLLISIAERLNDQSEVTKRLLRNPADISEVFGQYYSAKAAEEIGRLLTEHLKIGAALITALSDGQTNEADRLNKAWYKNADEMAMSFNGINPCYYCYEDLKEMLNTHLDLTTKEVAARLAGKYAEDIKAFEVVEREALAMADMFTAGIVRQFPKRFCQL